MKEKDLKIIKNIESELNLCIRDATYFEIEGNNDFLGIIKK